MTEEQIKDFERILRKRSEDKAYIYTIEEDFFIEGESPIRTYYFIGLEEIDWSYFSLEGFLFLDHYCYYHGRNRNLTREELFEAYKTAYSLDFAFDNEEYKDQIINLLEGEEIEIAYQISKGQKEQS